MRHRNTKHLKLSAKDTAHRNAVYRNLLTSLFEHKALITTEKRALAIVPQAHRLIEVANSATEEFNKIRTLMQTLYTDTASRSLLACAGVYTDRSGGYTRITPLKYRDGDSAKLVKIELV